MPYRKTGSRVTSDTAIFLNSGWHLFASEPGTIETPQYIEQHKLYSLPAIVPGTVAQAHQQAGLWDINANEDFDAKDWWYQTSFEVDLKTSPGKKNLRFDGLATLAEVWLNGDCILKSDNMFQEYEVEVSQFLKSTNQLSICFRALSSALDERRPRPRWKTKLVSHQQLRWFRTSLLGRIPGWTPPVAPVGPWRDIVLENSAVYINDLSLITTVESDEGIVRLSCRIQGQAVNQSTTATLKCGNETIPLGIEQQDTEIFAVGKVHIKKPRLWWPHTHGLPALYPCELEVTAGNQSIQVSLGAVGFRSIKVSQDNGGFAASVNDIPVFCRGACWTINDIVSLSGSQKDLERVLKLAQSAGMNMIRVGGTMVYEDDIFYSLCDKLGIMVWQDFMFANMDYPIDDDQFEASVTVEISQQLARFQSHPCIAVYCGNSEIEQQSAMLGMPQELWRSTLFSQLIPGQIKKYHSDIPYVPSTPSGGTLPFHVGTGITHYYGVGAYMRPFTDVRRSDVQFTPECLGFSNVPEDPTINALFNGQLPVCHHPLWKSRVPRDTGAGWDFEDIRDHYLKELFQKDPVNLRCFNMEQYLALSRITTGEVMEKVFSEWRSTYSNCGGALVWFYKDLWPGAGWGIVDSLGHPKACYRYLQRVWQPQTVVLTDEGLDGIHIHVINEKEHVLEGSVELQLLRNGQVVVAQAERDFRLESRSKLTIGSDDLLRGFYDVTYAYKFGPENHDIAVATLLDNTGKTIAQAFYFVGNRNLIKYRNANIVAEAKEQQNGDYLVTLNSDVFLQAVHFDVKGYYPTDEYFHLMPGQNKVFLFQQIIDSSNKKFKGYVGALNLSEPIKITVI